MSTPCSPYGGDLKGIGTLDLKYLLLLQHYHLAEQKRLRPKFLMARETNDNFHNEQTWIA